MQSIMVLWSSGSVRLPGKIRVSDAISSRLLSNKVPVLVCFAKLDSSCVQFCCLHLRYLGYVSKSIKRLLEILYLGILFT